MNIEGRWRITEMDCWGRDAIDLLGAAFIEFRGSGGGQFRFIAVEGGLHSEHRRHNGRPHVKFTWKGNDECDPASGHGWTTLRKDGSLHGHIYVLHGEDSGFVARAFREEDGPVANVSPTRKRGRS